MYFYSIALLSLLSTGLAFAQSYPHAFPREGATKLFENERVIIWEVVWPNGTPQQYHRHRYDMTGVFLRWGPLRVTRPDGRVTESLEPFEVPRGFFQRKGVTHKEEGIGEPERHSISVDLKEYRPPDLPRRTDIPMAFPRAGADAVVDSPRVTIWDYTWQPGQQVPLHFHDKDAVAVFIDGGTILSRSEDGTEATTTWAYKDVRFLPRNRTHTEEAVSGSPRAMIIELKN